MNVSDSHDGKSPARGTPPSSHATPTATAAQPPQPRGLLHEPADAHQFQAWHASPPCQAHTNAQKIQGRFHLDLIPPTRRMFEEANAYRMRNGVEPVPYVIENVPGSPLVDPVELCGAMFGLETYRHRLFETNWDLASQAHPVHVARTTKMGRAPVGGEYMHIVGNFSGVDRGRKVMGMPWANRDGLREAIPPAYTQYIGRQLIQHIEQVSG
ncbi:hypothetical protein D514_0102260 [Microbacterium sp. UCD-TDU]|nr:hypothetical protein D514_0102260 [Microbacterium sp. UCD-TDU]